MNIDILRANPTASALLAGIGVNIGDAVQMANAAQAELMKRKTAEEAAAIAALVAGFEAAAISNVGHQTDLRTQLETAEANQAALAKAKDYMLAGNSSWPLKKLIGIPVPKDIKEAKLDEVPADWTAPAAASAA